MSKRLIAISVACIALCAASLHAAVKYWDINGATAGAGGATPSGTWDTGTTANWTTDSTGSSAATTWASANTAIFSAGTDATGLFTVTLVGTETIDGFSANEGYGRGRSRRYPLR